jgi:hypothetical protein
MIAGFATGIHVAPIAVLLGRRVARTIGGERR